jgi:hypothetical protein
MPNDGTRKLTFDAFDGLRRAVSELRDRGYSVDVGALSAIGMQDSVSQTFEQAAREAVPEATPIQPPSEETDAPDPRALDAELSSAVRPLDDGETVGKTFDSDEDQKREHKAWCGICGEGPFQSLSHHHRKMHDGEAVPMAAPLPEWCAGKPDLVVNSVKRADGRMEAATVLNEAAKFDTVLNLHRRLPTASLSGTKTMLDRLGLLAPDESNLHTDKDARIEALREVVEGE